MNDDDKARAEIEAQRLIVRGYEYALARVETPAHRATIAEWTRIEMAKLDAMLREAGIAS
jgi:hypothetical protein